MDRNKLIIVIKIITSRLLLSQSRCADCSLFGLNLTIRWKLYANKVEKNTNGNRCDESTPIIILLL